MRTRFWSILFIFSSLCTFVARADDPVNGNSSHLPLVLIYTHGVKIPDEPKTNVMMGIIDNGPGHLNHISDRCNVYDGLVGIELRGSSSQQFPKKSFGFEARKPSLQDTCVSLLGLPAESDWVLYAPYSDKSLVRNTLAYYLFGRFGHYSPRTRMVELYLDDEYHGLYVLVEKIKRSPSRVNIDKLSRNDIHDEELTGGYILKLDKGTGDENNAGFYSRNAPTFIDRPHFFTYDYPDEKDIRPEQREYIQDRVNDFEASLRNADYRDPVKGYRSFIDVQSFVDFFILNELSKNIDGYRLSSYFYKDRDDVDPKFHAGPPWDFDIAFGNCYYGGAEQCSGWQYLYKDDDHPVPFWWARLLADPYFTGNLKCRWNNLREGVLHTDSISDIVEGMIETIGDAADRNFEAYPILGRYVWPNPYIGNNYQEEITYLKDWIKRRAGWLDEHIPGTCVITDNPEHEQQSFQAKIYPNPAKDQINLEILNPEKKKLQVSVYQMTGQLVFTEYIEKDIHSTAHIILPPGIYQVILRDDLYSLALKALVN